ncbi:MAG: hypothetical protein MdMp014T_1119 [Treponematales bacterium]
MKHKEDCEYQHFISKFLLRNFTDNPGRTHTYKNENGTQTEHNVGKTGGEYSFYGPKACSIERFFGNVENYIASAVNKHSILDGTDKAYLKIFILLMAHRSPSKDKIINEKYSDFIKGLRANISEEDIISYFEGHRINQEKQLSRLADDIEINKITTKFLNESFDDNDNSKFFPVMSRVLLEILPKPGRLFDVHIFECESDLIIGETPTLSVNLSTNEVKTNGEEAGLINKNVMYWVPIAHNKVAFMYSKTNIHPIKDRKLRKQEADILNYYQKMKSPYFYSRTKNVDIPELPSDFKWLKDFNYIFGYKTSLCPLI